MNMRRFLSIVPNPFKIAAWALTGCAVLAGTTATLLEAMKHGPTSGPGAAPLLLAAAARGFAFGVIGALFIVVWVLCLGYVYADARGRTMPPVLWTLVAALIPNLLGFLLYFACRRPIALPCPHCGRPIAAGLPFCSWCGKQASPMPA